MNPSPPVDPISPTPTPLLNIRKQSIRTQQRDFVKAQEAKPESEVKPGTHPFTGRKHKSGCRCYVTNLVGKNDQNFVYFFYTEVLVENEEILVLSIFRIQSAIHYQDMRVEKDAKLSKIFIQNFVQNFEQNRIDNFLSGVFFPGIYEGIRPLKFVYWAKYMCYFSISSLHLAHTMRMPSSSW